MCSTTGSNFHIAHGRNTRKHWQKSSALKMIRGYWREWMLTELASELSPAVFFLPRQGIVPYFTSVTFRNLQHTEVWRQWSQTASVTQWVYGSVSVNYIYKIQLFSAKTCIFFKLRMPSDTIFFHSGWTWEKLFQSSNQRSDKSTTWKIATSGLFLCSKVSTISADFD